MIRFAALGLLVTAVLAAIFYGLSFFFSGGTIFIWMMIVFMSGVTAGCFGAAIAMVLDDEWLMSALMGFSGVLCAGLVVLLIGIATDDSPIYVLRQQDWVCTRSHTETNLQPVVTGRTTILVPTTDVVCDQYTRR